jgi:phage baseplate assembly protein W
MEFIVSAIANKNKVNFAPSSVMEEVIQNVQTIIATPIYSTPLNRSFGVDAIMLDLPLPVLQAKLAAEIVQAIEKFEPRVAVVKVNFTGNAESGNVKPYVTLSLKG